MFIGDKTKSQDKTLLQVLVESNKIKPETSKDYQNLSNQDLVKKLKNEGILTDEDIGRAYGVVFDIPFISIKDIEIKPEASQIIPENLAKDYKIIPYEINASQIKIAVGEPERLTSNLKEVIQGLRDKKKIDIQLAVAPLEDINKKLESYVNNDNKVDKKDKIEASGIGQTDEHGFDWEDDNTENEQDMVISVQSPPIIKTDQKTPAVNLKDVKIPIEVISKFPEEIAKKYQMIVFEAPHASFIKVAIAHPNDQKIKEILDFVRDKNDIAIEEYHADSNQIEGAMKYYHPELLPKEEPKPVEPPKPPPVVKAPEPKYEPKTTQEEKVELDQVRKEVKDESIPEPEKIAPVSAPEPTPKLTPIAPPVVQEEGPRVFVLRPEELGQEQKQPKLNIITKSEDLKKDRYGVPIVTKEEVPIVQSKQDLSQTQITNQDRDLDAIIGQPLNDVQDLEAMAESGHIPKIVASIVALGVKKQASDIHIEPHEKELRLRLRVDGILKDIIKLPIEMHPAIISRIKILAKLKIDESRIPQDGRFDVTTDGHQIDLRISSLPTVHGEKIAMRILDKSLKMYTMEELGIEGQNFNLLKASIDKPYGIVLSTGPTGSGKSTTLYAILNRISTASVNIVTLEDPVEYEIPGINQCQIKPKIGFSFASGLRSILRQDPNIIMVGEIRDAETASLATHAALTGHLVLSTLHTNDSAGAIPRLTNMGIEPFLITSSLNAIIGQRLVRRLCQKCRKPAHIPEPVLQEIDKELVKFNLPKPYNFFEGRGCPECDQGYKGRIGIYEVLPMTDKIEVLAISRKPSSDIKTEAMNEGMITMKQDGLFKALKGITTVNEIMRVITV